MTQTQANSPRTVAAAPSTRFNLLPKLSVLMLAQAFTPLAFAADTDWNLDRVRANEAFRQGKTGAGSVIGILDDGLFDDPAFAGRIDPRSANFGLGGAGAFRPTDRESFHGTMVAGIAAANGRNGDVRGVAPGATILVARGIGVENDRTDDDSDDASADGTENARSRAIRYLADAGAKVINGSFGPPTFSEKKELDDTPNTNHIEQSGHYIAFNPVKDQLDFGDIAAIEYAASKDVLMVFAAGNEYTDQPVAARNPSGNALIPLISPANHGSGAYLFVDGTSTKEREDVRSEADIPFIQRAEPRLASIDYSHLKRNIIAVVATDRDNQIASYSNRCGDAWQWCIAAPGGEDTPTPEDQEKPETASGEGKNTSSDPLGFRKIWRDGERTVEHFAGTSGATPHVAGAAAIVRSEFPFLTAAQTQEVILTTANNSGHLNDYRIYGRGLLDVERASRGPGEFGAEGFDKVFDIDTKGLSGTFSNDIRGDGGLTKRGAGTLELTGTNTFSGATTVAGGTLQVSGSTLRSNTKVQAGGTLTGSGAVGNLVSSGVVAPGGPAGKTLTLGATSPSCRRASSVPPWPAMARSIACWSPARPTCRAAPCK